MRTLWEQARTLRERAFILLTSYPEGYWRLAINPEAALQEHIRASFVNPERRKILSSILIWLPTSSGCALHPGLQDLANILSIEADEAFYSDYYPRLPDVDVPPEHVREVIEALQREMDREAQRRKMKPVRFGNLPWERQCALTERRRYWFGQFGITPAAWERGAWSLWRVRNRALPEEVRARFH